MRILIIVGMLLLTALLERAPAQDAQDVTPPITSRTRALLCADQADNRIRLIDPLIPAGRSQVLWSYPAEGEAALAFLPTDAKRVEIDGVVHVLAAYHGRVRLVRFHDRKLIKDYPSYDSCHSAEMLPDGTIVSASSNDGKLRLHRSAEEFVDLDLPYAHGVTWDKKRQCLWALGDQLYRIHQVEGNLVVDRKYPLPLSPSGHDLFPLRGEAKLLVSNNPALFLFDIPTGKFEQISRLGHVKSASQHADGSIWVSDPDDLEGARTWQSDAVLRVRPDGPVVRHVCRGARFYKARWWQKVSFSY